MSPTTFRPVRTVLLATLATLTLSASPVLAATPTVTVKNLGQKNLVSTVPQAPLAVTARGTCGDTRTVEEANGETASCPAGTWPVQGDPGWFAQTVDAIVGDTLELTFAEAPDFVTATLTTVYPIGLRTPPCPTSPTGPEPCANGDVPVLNTGATLLGTRDDDRPGVWTFKLPYPLPGTQVAVTASGPDDAAANYAFGLASPRWEDESAKCGTAFFAPGDARPRCPANDIKGQAPGGSTGPNPISGGVDPATTAKPLSLSLVGAPALRGSSLKLVASASTAGKLIVALRRGGVTLVRRTTEVAAGKTAKTFTLTKAQRRKLARHPGHAYYLVIKLESGGKSASTSAVVKWRAR